MSDEEYKTVSESSNGHWWDFYFVRYCVGTVVGALLVFYVFFSGKNSGDDFFKEAYEFLAKGDYGLLILPVVGLAYCYLASAPVLVLHACRSVIKSDKEIPIFLSFMGCIILISMLYFCPVLPYSAAAISSLTGISIFAFQAALIYKTIGIRSGFYQDLSEEKSKVSSSRKEFIESYKHLREHGNAFMIVVMEIVLGVILLGAKKPQDFIVVLLAWIFPAAYVWLVGTFLEGEMIK